MAKSFTAAQWTKVEALTDARGAAFGLPARRGDSVVLASFNIRKIGRIKNKSPGAWAFLKRFCERCDLIAVQEVQDNLEALVHLKGLLGKKYGLAVSDVTGGIAGKQAMVERLAFLFRWDRIERSEVASDITIDRSAVLDTLYEERADFKAAFETRVAELAARQTEVDRKLAPWQLAVAAWQAAGRPGRKPRKPKTPGKPPFVLPHFLTFIRTPHCASFRVKGKPRAEPYEFIAVNAHLLYGHKGKQADERRMEFSGLLKWLIERARLPRPADKKKAGSVAGGYDFGMFDFVNLFAEALHGKPFDRLTAKQQTALIARFQHDVSDHMPIWIRLAKPR